jgi:hypothetical protein
VVLQRVVYSTCHLPTNGAPLSNVFGGYLGACGSYDHHCCITWIRDDQRPNLSRRHCWLGLRSRHVIITITIIIIIDSTVGAPASTLGPLAFAREPTTQKSRINNDEPLLLRLNESWPSQTSSHLMSHQPPWQGEILPLPVPPPPNADGSSVITCCRRGAGPAAAASFARCCATCTRAFPAHTHTQAHHISRAPPPPRKPTSR